MLKRSTDPKPPAVPVLFIRPDSESGVRLYRLLRELVHAYHDEIADARIALAWQTTWKPDVDGRCTLGECKKVSELEREVADLLAYDFVILLRQEFWYDPRVTDHQRRALLDHELMHAAVKVDEHGERVVNERGRIVYRLRKHDLEEFADIADRYGCWKKDLEHFAMVLDRARSRLPYWVSASRLKDELAAVGAGIPLDAILEWSQAECREAETWTILQREAPNIASRPTHVTAALSVDAPKVAPDLAASEGARP